MLMEDTTTETKHDLSGIGPHRLTKLYTMNFGEKYCGLADLVVMGENGPGEHIYGRWMCGYERRDGVLTVGELRTLVPLTVGGLLVGLEIYMEVDTEELDGPGICIMLTGSPLLSGAKILSRVHGYAGP
jgi:hypothetical protein